MIQSLDPVTLRKVQLMELKCLNEVRRICEANNIQYFLIGGTLIGAVRHKGFIPWDDDIDIGMLRSDYDRFCEICKTQLNTELFYFQNWDTEENNADYEISRIRLNNTKFVLYHRQGLKSSHHGFYVEVIPYDDLPKGKLRCHIYGTRFRGLKRLVGVRKGYKYRLSNPVKRYIFYFIVNLSKIIPIRHFEKILETYHKKYFNTNSEYVFLLGGAYKWYVEKHLRSTVSEYTELEFEGQMYPVPKNYDLFLTEQYGNYMQFPPKEKQVNKCAVVELDFGPYKD